ncbi:MAG TPA: sel1 repeat family protein [Dokdonella sp.]|uniref:sel1 repeat family protein n=1 Tax=Dokdonella sp. TaxID=2291710 RepID=UPI002D0C0EC7|nr:sel1 repeat family protein [Dokdonella sp.]HUD43419.1 sel1 repeat family protein [Dokdonella sp.]
MIHRTVLGAGLIAASLSLSSAAFAVEDGAAAQSDPARGAADADVITISPREYERTVAKLGRVNPVRGYSDVMGFSQGLAAHARGRYASAMKFFLIGARYADKPSQLSIGLMYLNGEGVAADPATAYAWIDLAAERQYPDFVTTRDRVAAQLSPEQRARAERIRADLAAEYGDAVAKRRVAGELGSVRLNTTGSRTGYDDLSVRSASSAASNGGGNCMNIGGIVIGNIVIGESGCGQAVRGLNDVNPTDPKAYFALRDAQWKGTATVGPLQPLEQTPPAEKAEPAPSGD